MKKIFKLESSDFDPYVLLSFALLVIGFSVTRIADYDFWWHLNLGKSIVETLSITPADTFSYTYSGTRQFSSEWLADCIMYFVFKSGGYLGINILKVAILLAMFALLMKTHQLLGDSRNRVWFYSSVVTLVITLFALRFRFYIRPFLFTFLLLAAFVYLLTRYEVTRERRILFLLPMIELVWANLSKGAFYGPFIIGCYLAWELVRQRESAKEVSLAVAATFALSLLNPESYHIYSLILDYAVKGDAVVVGEHQPLSAKLLWGYGLGYTLGYQVLVLGAAVYFAFCRGWRNLFHLLLFAGFFIPTLMLVRMIDLFSIVSCMFTFKAINACGESLFAPLARRRVLAASVCSAALMLIFAVTVPGNRTYAFGLGPKEANIPEGAIAFLDREGIKGPIFNSFVFGGYIPWRSPEKKIFIDGRVLMLYPMAFHKEYFRIINDAAQWQKAEDRWGFSIAVLEYDLKSQWQHFPRHLADNPAWALVYWDNHSLVYVKRTPERARMIAEREYRAARPTFLDLSYLDRYQQQGRVNEVLPLLDREVAINPDNQFVVLARIYLRYQLGKLYLGQIRDDLERILPLKPDFAMKHSAMAMVLAESGEPERAKAELLQALRLDPLDAAALAQAKALGIKVKLPKGGIPGHP